MASATMKILTSFVKATSSSDEAIESINFGVTTAEDVFSTLPENHIRLLRLESRTQSESRAEDPKVLRVLLKTFPLETVRHTWQCPTVGVKPT